MKQGANRAHALYRDNYERLAEVKARYDPTNFFRVNQNVQPKPGRSGFPTKLAALHMDRMSMCGQEWEQKTSAGLVVSDAQSTRQWVA